VDIRSKRAQTKENNRRVILDAARGVFGRDGYRTATVRDIINSTPLASGTFYNYFRSKEEVYAALRDEMAHEVRPLLRTERQRARTADDFIAGTFRTFLSQAQQRAQSLAAIDLRDDQMLAGMRMIVMGGDDLRRDIEAAAERGLFPRIDAELLAAAIVGIAFEVADVMRQRQHTDVNSAARFCSELILHGVASVPVAEDDR
jgi:AcrR family transcriptional regulator